MIILVSRIELPLSTKKVIGTVVHNTLDPGLNSQDSQLKKLLSLLYKGNLAFDVWYRMVKCYIWSILPYRVKIWTLKATSIYRIIAFEMWILVRQNPNDGVLKRTGIEGQLFYTIIIIIINQSTAEHRPFLISSTSFCFLKTAANWWRSSLYCTSSALLVCLYFAYPF